MLQDSVERFLDALASAAPTPGGGSVAALLGAMGAALDGMVCNLTVGKPAYAAVDGETRRLLERGETLRRRLAGLVATDMDAFAKLMATYRLPRASEPEREARAAAIQAALKAALEVPLECARACAAVVALSVDVARIGNVSVLSDAAVAALAAHAGLRSALLNVEVNGTAMVDRAYLDERLAGLDALEAESAGRVEATLAAFRARAKGG